MVNLFRICCLVKALSGWLLRLSGTLEPDGGLWDSRLRHCPGDRARAIDKGGLTYCVGCLVSGPGQDGMMPYVMEMMVRFSEMRVVRNMWERKSGLWVLQIPELGSLAITIFSGQVGERTP